MVSRKITIGDLSGLHLKPAQSLCTEAIKYQSKISLRFQNTEANMKSMISILSACVKCGNEIEIVCDGADEEEALNHLLHVIDTQINHKTEN